MTALRSPKAMTVYQRKLSGVAKAEISDASGGERYSPITFQKVKLSGKTNQHSLPYKVVERNQAWLWCCTETK